MKRKKTGLLYSTCIIGMYEIEVDRLFEDAKCDTDHKFSDDTLRLRGLVPALVQPRTAELGRQDPHENLEE